MKKQSSDPEEIRKAVEERIRAEDQALEQSAGEKVHGNGKIDSKFIQQCLFANELGDGLLYAAMNRGKFTYNASSGEWMRWAGHTWERDQMETALSAVEDVVDRLLDEAGAIGEKIVWCSKNEDDGRKKVLEAQRDKIFSRVRYYRADKGRNAMLKFARTCRDPLAVIGDKFDTVPHLIGCVNGVLDLRAGNFRDGRPDEYISKSTGVPWQGFNAPCNKWKAWLNEVFDQDQDLIEFLKRFFGYAATGWNREHVFLVLWGQGRNGKGTLVEILFHVLGRYAGPIQSEMLLDQGRTRSAAGPSPDIMRLKGLRLAFASETDEGRRFSSSRVKWLSGGDTLIGRHPHDKHETTFLPSHSLILLTNSKPDAPAGDFAFWERLILIPFKLSFVDRDLIQSNERRARKGIIDELKQEGPGILAWLVEGCLEYQRDGLNPPRSVRDATSQYRREVDILADWMEARCVLGDLLEEKSEELYKDFRNWWEENVSKKAKSLTAWGRVMGQRFERGTLEGKTSYKGIGLNLNGS